MTYSNLRLREVLLIIVWIIWGSVHFFACISCLKNGSYAFSIYGGLIVIVSVLMILWILIWKHTGKWKVGRIIENRVVIDEEMKWRDVMRIPDKTNLSNIEKISGWRKGFITHF